ncbi:hypothetical protein LFUMFP_130120 [Latilactobacillus fuchuensis]|uniref:Uncharacterized protein n=1 Tax=Latilactobacillus fuchuensis TaxID=164393 RepID=A0A2N9DTU6_9LACO|nr:hypothetical protein LFUMFP_130120 [Latilactobacillus fuchuensis]
MFKLLIRFLYFNQPIEWYNSRYSLFTFKLTKGYYNEFYVHMLANEIPIPDRQIKQYEKRGIRSQVLV